MLFMLTTLSQSLRIVSGRKGKHWVPNADLGELATEAFFIADSDMNTFVSWHEFAAWGSVQIKAPDMLMKIVGFQMKQKVVRRLRQRRASMK